MSLALEQLRRLQAQAGVRAPASREVARAVDRDLPGMEIAPGLRLREQRLPCDAFPAVLDAGFAKFGEVETSRLLCIDTETTGLAGGTGTRAFMIGALDWHDATLRLRQLTLTTLTAEAAMLTVFASWIDAQAVLVSYNGKSYDAPLLATRYRLQRMANPLLGLGHLDLLHPARRRWRGRWENCRLATIERQVLGVVREDDLPGAEAPAAWLSYLRGGSARNLRRVAAHNAQDLRSLGQLCWHLSGAVATRPHPEYALLVCR